MVFNSEISLTRNSRFELPVGFNCCSWIQLFQWPLPLDKPITHDHTATHCKTLQHTTTKTRRVTKLFLPCHQCKILGCFIRATDQHDPCVLQCVAVCCSVLQCVAVCCSVLQCVAVLIRADQHDQHTATHCNTLQHTATHCNTQGSVSSELHQSY